MTNANDFETQLRDDVADWFHRVPHPNPITKDEALARVFQGPWMIVAVNANSVTAADDDLNYAAKAVLRLYPPLATVDDNDGEYIELRVMPKLLGDLLGWESDPEFGLNVIDEYNAGPFDREPTYDELLDHGATIGQLLPPQ